MTNEPTDSIDADDPVRDTDVPEAVRLRITVERPREFHDRAAARLEALETGNPPDEHVRSFATVERLRRIFTEKRVELIETLLETQPESITALAEQIDRAVSDVHDDLQILADEGVVELQEEGRRVRPVIPYESVHIDVTFERGDSGSGDSVSRNSNEGEYLNSYLNNANEHAKSIEDQVRLVEFLYEEGITPGNSGLTRNEVSQAVGEIDYGISTLLGHLEDVGLIEEHQPSGPSTYVVSERLGQIINGQVEEVVAEDLDALIAHMDDEIYDFRTEQFDEGTAVAVPDGAGRTIRQILAAEFDIQPDAVEDYLREGNGDRLERLNRAIKAIEASEEVSKSGEYGKILFRKPAKRYRLTEKAIGLLADD